MSVLGDLCCHGELIHWPRIYLGVFAAFNGPRGLWTSFRCVQRANSSGHLSANLLNRARRPYHSWVNRNY